MENNECQLRDLGLCAVLQLRGQFPIQTTLEQKDGRDYVLFTFTLNQESKKIIADYRLKKLTVEPNEFITIYKSIKRSVSKIRWGTEPQIHKEAENGTFQRIHT